MILKVDFKIYFFFLNKIRNSQWEEGNSSGEILRLSEETVHSKENCHRKLTAKLTPLPINFAEN